MATVKHTLVFFVQPKVGVHRTEKRGSPDVGKGALRTDVNYIAHKEPDMYCLDCPNYP